MSESRLLLHDQSMSVIERYAKCIVKNSKGENREQLNTLTNHMKFYCESREKFKLSSEVFEEVARSISQEQTTEQTLAIYDVKLGEMLKTVGNISNDDRFIKFMGLLQGEDEDICAIMENLNTIDPITKQRLVEPVKNVKCGHSYEKTSILQLIAKRPHTRCPIVGCSAKTYVHKEDLVPDMELQRYLASEESQMPAAETDKSVTNLNDSSFC